MKLFGRKQTAKNRVPAWSEIVEAMHGKGLNYIEGYKIIDVIYSPDNAHRFIILEIDNDYFTYWLPHDNGAKPIFDDMEILMRELKTTPDYKTFFDNE